MPLHELDEGLRLVIPRLSKSLRRSSTISSTEVEDISGLSYL